MDLDNELKRIKDFVYRTLRESKFYNEYSEREYKMPRVHWMKTRSTRVAGLAYPKLGKLGYYKIEINPHYYREQGFDGMIETIVHELSHILQFVIYPTAKQAHGPEFKSIMRGFGYQPLTYHSMPRPQTQKKGQKSTAVKRKYKKTRYKYRLKTGREVFLTKSNHQKIQDMGMAHLSKSGVIITRNDFHDVVTFY